MTAGETRSALHRTWAGIGRAIGGALIFSLPMMMTLEMWEIGFDIDPLRLLILILFSLPLWVGVSSIVGFEKTKGRLDDLRDVLIAYAIGFFTCALILSILGIVTRGLSLGAIFSMLLLQAVPASLGALLGRSLIRGGDEENKEELDRGYHHELIILLTGSLFLAFNMAPTEGIILISYKMEYGHMCALLLFTLVLMHLFELSNPDISSTSLRSWKTHGYLFVRFTSTGYLLAFIMSLFMLWVLGRTEGESVNDVINSTLVLSFPAAIGAAAARLIM